MATLAVQQITTDGIVPNFGAAAGGGDEFPNSGREYVEIVNGLVDVNITFVSQQVGGDGLAVADRTELVSASTTQKFGPFPPSVYNDGNQKLQITYDDASNVTIGVFRLP
jgi:hypothetical protein